MSNKICIFHNYQNYSLIFQFFIFIIILFIYFILYSKNKRLAPLESNWVDFWKKIKIKINEKEKKYINIFNKENNLKW